MKIFSFGTTLSTMKKITLLSFFIAVSVCGIAQSNNNATLKIAKSLNKLNYPQYGDIYLFGKETDFYVVAEDVVPIQCNKLVVYAYYKDYINGSKANDYWVFQGNFDFSITPHYKSYSLNLKAYKVGQYKVMVSGYTNGTYTKYFGIKTFRVKSSSGLYDYLKK